MTAQQIIDTARAIIDGPSVRIIDPDGSVRRIPISNDYIDVEFRVVEDAPKLSPPGLAVS